MAMKRYLLRSNATATLFKTLLTGRHSQKVVEISYEVAIADHTTAHTFGNWLDADHFYRSELARRSQEVRANRT